MGRQSSYLDPNSLSPEERPIILRQFARLLDEGECYEDLHLLFDDDTWMQARFENSNYTYDGFLEDLNRAWNAAKASEEQTGQQSGIDQRPIIKCIRYLLIRTSINSLAGNYPPALISKALDVGLWTPDQASSIVVNIPDAERCIDMSTVLLSKPSLTPKQRGEIQHSALEKALSETESWAQAQALANLIPFLSREQRQQVFQVARTFSSAPERAKVLAALLPPSYLPEPQRFIAHEEALQAVLAIPVDIPDVQERAEALAALVRYFPEQQCLTALEETLQAVLDPYEEWIPFFSEELAQTLGTLASCLTREQFQYMLDKILSFSNERALRPQATSKQLQDLRSTMDKEWSSSVSQAQAQALAVLLHPSLFDEEQCQRILRASYTLPNTLDQAKVLAALVPHLSGRQRLKACEEVLQADPTQEQVELLSPPLIDSLSDEQIQRALQTALEKEQVEVLVALLPRLSDEQQRFTVCRKALQAVFDQGQEQLLAPLSPFLNDEELLQYALRGVRGLSDKREQAQAFAILVPYLQGKQLQQALQAVKWDLSVQNLLALLPDPSDGQLSPTTLIFVLETALTLNTGTGDRAEVLAALAPYLNSEQLQRAWEAALAISDAFFSVHRKVKGTQAYALAALARFMPEPQRLNALEHALQVALTFSSKHKQIDALVLLLSPPHLLSEQQHFTALSRAVEVALTPPTQQEQTTILPVAEQRAAALASLARYLPNEQRLHALQITCKLPDELARARILATLAPHLDEDLRYRILVCTLEHALSSDATRAELLGILAPLLTGELLQRAWQASNALPDPRIRAVTLTKFLSVPGLGGLPQSIRQAMVEAIGSREHFSRKEILSELFIKDLFRPAALECYDPIFSPEALCNIASHLFDICEDWIWL